MPRLPDPKVRLALIETAARILATEGPARLTLRHLAREVGTSTMAIYTHFGGMEALRIEVCTEGFRRLATFLGSVEHSDDPVTDLFALGRMYAGNARENPHLYRAMFLDPLPLGTDAEPSGARSTRDDRDGSNATMLRTEAGATFEVLVASIQRCIDAGRFTQDNSRGLAAELWAATHGLMALELAGMSTPDLTDATLVSVSRHLAIAFGDTPRKVEASITSAGIQLKR